jgi:imidazolonepropionase-like amidohydrolase
MKTKISIGFIALAASLQCLAQTPEQIINADVIIRDIGVVTMIQPSAQEHQMVCISKGIITFIGKDAAAKELKTNAKVINGTGKYIMPGMADMHCHLPEKKEIKNYFTLNIMSGVTTLRSMQGNNEHLEYRKMTDAPVPNLYLSAPPVLTKKIISNSVADSMIGKYKAEGFDFVKILYVNDSASFAAIMLNAKKYNMPVCGHLPKCVSLEYVLQSGYNSIEHMGGIASAYDKGMEYYQSTLTLTKKNNVYHCPTMDWYQIAYHELSEDEMKKRFGMELIEDSVKQKWSKSIADDIKKAGEEKIAKDKAEYKITQEKQLKALKLIADNNVGLLIGLDAGGLYEVPGFEMIEEMKIYKRAGLSNYQILQAATINAARYLKQDGKWGSVETNKDANLILLSANPLIDIEAITKVEGIFLNGKYYLPKDLKKNLE